MLGEHPVLGHSFATFSIAARDPDNGDLGVAVASKFLAVGWAVIRMVGAGENMYRPC